MTRPALRGLLLVALGIVGCAHASTPAGPTEASACRGANPPHGEPTQGSVLTVDVPTDGPSAEAVASFFCAFSDGVASASWRGSRVTVSLWSDVEHPAGVQARMESMLGSLPGPALGGRGIAFCSAAATRGIDTRATHAAHAAFLEEHELVHCARSPNLLVLEPGFFASADEADRALRAFCGDFATSQGDALRIGRALVLLDTDDGLTPWRRWAREEFVADGG